MRGTFEQSEHCLALHVRLIKILNTLKKTSIKRKKKKHGMSRSWSKSCSVGTLVCGSDLDSVVGRSVNRSNVIKPDLLIRPFSFF